MSQWPEFAAFDHFESLALELCCLKFLLVYAKGRRGVRCLDVLLGLSGDESYLSQNKFMAGKEGCILKLGRSPLIEN